VRKRVISNTSQWEKAMCPACGEYTARLYDNGMYQCCSNRMIPRCDFFGKIEDLEVKDAMRRVRKI
jgi:hypothetical protein